MRKLIIICLACLMGLVLQAQDAEAIIKEYELELWKTALEDIFDAGSDELNLGNSIESIRTALGESEDEKYKEKFPSFQGINRVNVFTQVNSVRGDSVTLEGIQIILKNLRGTDQERLKKVFNKAKNDVRLLCFWGDKNCLTRVKETIRDAKKFKRINEIKDLSKINSNDVSQVQKLQKVAKAKETFIEKNNVSVWKRVQKEVEEYNSSYEDDNITLKMIDVDFPIMCTDCAMAYQFYILGKSSKENVCIKQINKSKTHKPFFDKLDKTRLTYSAYVADQSKEGAFKTALADFGDFYKDNENKSHFDFDNNFDNSNKNRNSSILNRTVTIPVLYLIFLGLLLLLIASLLVVQAFERRKNKTMNNGNEDGDSEIQKVLTAREKEILELRNNLSEEKEKVENLNKENIQLRRELDAAKIKKVIPAPAPAYTVPVGIEELPVPEYEHQFYALRPDGDNGFLINNLSEDIEDQLYYVIVDQGDGTAEFWLTEDAELQKSAARSANTILNDACEYENLPRETKTGIHTTVKGKLKKSTNLKEWEIVSKAKIKFV